MSLCQRLNPLSNNQGMALVFVLWILILLSVIAGGFSYAMRDELRSAGLVRAEAQAYYMAYTGIQAGLFMLEKDRIGGRKVSGKDQPETWEVNSDIPVQNTGNGFFSIQVNNESGKININYADSELLTLLFQAMDLPEDQVSEIVDSILDWRDEDTLRRLHGAESPYYQSLPQPYKARDNLFKTPCELLYVKGMTPELYVKIKPMVTTVLLGKDNSSKREKTRSKINVNAASAGVLSIFPGMTPDLIEQIAIFRKESGDLRNIGTIMSMMKNKTSAHSILKMAKFIDYTCNSFYTIEASGWTQDDTLKQTIRVLVEKKTKAKQKYKIVQWVDRVYP